MTADHKTVAAQECNRVGIDKGMLMPTVRALTAALAQGQQ